MARNTKNPKNKQTTKAEKLDYPIEEFVADQKAAEDEEPIQKDTTTKVVVQGCKQLRLRDADSTIGNVVELLPSGVELTVDNYDPKAEWALVTHVNSKKLNKKAYVMTNYIEVV